MKKLLLLLILACVGLFLFGCGNSSQKDVSTKSSESTQKKQAKKNVALVMKTLTNPFFIEMEKGARKAENELGINLIVKTGAKETSIEQQISIVEELISMKVDAIVIAPGSSTELIPVLKKAQDAKIQIVNIDNRLDPVFSKKTGLVDVPFISVNNENGAFLSAKVISDKITKPTKVAVFEGIRGADNAEQRKQGALRAFKANSNIEIVASETANWKIDEALELANTVFGKNPDIGAVFCANDMMALGVIQYLEKSGKKEVMVAGYDALDDVKKAISEGKMAVTIDQQADLQGYLGVKQAYEMIQGKKQALETTVDVKVVTKESLSK